MKIKNYIFIHICQRGKWRLSLDLLLNAINKSGLYEFIDKIYCGILMKKGKVANLSFIDDFISLNEKDKNKFKILFEKDDIFFYERPTLLSIKKKSLTKNFNLLYLHTKGIDDLGYGLNKKTIDWMNFMIYWNIYVYKLAIKKLTQGYFTYGVKLIKINKNSLRGDYEGLIEKNNTNHYRYLGNFWWSNSSHIKNLLSYISERYDDPKLWLFETKQKFNINNHFQPINALNFNPKQEIMSLKNYIFLPIKIKKIIMAYYGNKKFMKVTKLMERCISKEKEFFYFRVLDEYFTSKSSKFTKNYLILIYIDQKGKKRKVKIPQNLSVFSYLIK